MSLMLDDETLRQGALDPALLQEQARLAAMTPIGVEEVAQMLQAHPNTVRTLARRGELPAAKVGKSWLFYRSQVNAWLLSRMSRASDKAPEPAAAQATPPASVFDPSRDARLIGGDRRPAPPRPGRPRLNRAL